jgi:methylenetetrahydrofolate dehydrogenase (NADP+)/methenyltetrahydrofolate cyclohydrolase
MQIIDGKAVAEKIESQTRASVERLRARGITPGLAVILVGADPASQAYVRSKDRMCRSLGMHSLKHELPAHTSQADLITLVHQLNADPSIHGILVQSPPPAHIDERAVVEAVDPRKDVDGFHPVNVAKVALGLMQKGLGGDATVTVAHSRTRDIAAVCRTADILIAAIGKPRFVTADFIKPGAVVIDVGINRIEDPTAPKGSRLVGDVDF